MHYFIAHEFIGHEKRKASGTRRAASNSHAFHIGQIFLLVKVTYNLITCISGNKT